ncbi:MAG: aspartate aminotransferase family protein [Aureliella sp.]
MNENSSQDGLESRFRLISPACYNRDHDPAFGAVFESGLGSLLTASDGSEWVDLTCGYSATNFGHCNKDLVDALTEQASRLCHLTGDPNGPRIRLAERLAEGCFPNRSDSKVLFSTSGARAIEAAWKAAVSFRPGKMVSLAPSLHGRTIATSRLGATTSTQVSEDLDRFSIVVPTKDYPYCSQCPLGVRYPECATQCVDSLLDHIAVNHGQISAVLVEPALTARGYIFPPAEFFLRLRKCTQECGVLLIADEIQSGMGRCGSLLLSQAQGWTPDLVTLGKSLGGGIMPLAAVVGRSDVLDAIPPGAESETASGSPLACAVGYAAIRLLTEGRLAERGAKLGDELRRHAIQLIEVNELNIRVDGKAACCVFEFAHPTNQAPASNCEGEHPAERAQRFARLCVEHRLKVHLSGPGMTRVVLLPALTMTNDELDMACERLSAVGKQFAEVVT